MQTTGLFSSSSPQQANVGGGSSLIGTLGAALVLVFGVVLLTGLSLDRTQTAMVRFLAEKGVALVTALEAVLKKRPSVRGPGAEMGTITISQRVAKAIANAEALAKRLRDEYVSVEHIFAELLREPASTGLGR